MAKVYVCDISGTCPYESEMNSSGMFCRNKCGMGVDEDEIDILDDDGKPSDYYD